MPLLVPEIKHYENRKGIFAVRMNDGRWQDHSFETLAAEYVHWRSVANVDSIVYDVARDEVQRAVDALNELDGVIPFTEALGKGDASEYDTELGYLVREAQRLAEQAAADLFTNTVNPLVAATIIDSENSVEGDGWALVDAAYLGRLRTAALSAPTAIPNQFKQAICELENMAGLAAEDGLLDRATEYEAAAKALEIAAAPTATASTLGEPEKQWVIVSLKEGRGLPYWRANGAGYADSITQAGFYTYTEARQHTSGTHGDDEKYCIDDPALQELISNQSYIRGKELALWLENAQLRAHPATVATGGAAEAGGGWVRCDGVADYQAEEDWAWVCMPDGSVQLATWKEAYWEDESMWVEATYTIPGHEGEKYMTPRFVWAEYYDEGRLHTLTPQPVHFQPKPAPHPDSQSAAPTEATSHREEVPGE